MLGLRAAHEAPDGGAREIGRVTDGAAGDEHEPRGGQRVVREPLAQHGERGVDGGVGLARGRGDQDRLRDVGAGIDQLRQVGVAEFRRDREVAEHGERVRCGRDVVPAQAQQRVHGPTGAQCGRIDGPRRQRAHGEDGPALLVTRAQLDRVAAVRDHGHAQRSGAVLEDLDAGERERQRHAPRLRAGAERVDGGVEGGVEERGVHSERAGVLFFLERDRRVDLALAPPDAGHALEGRAVVEAQVREAVVQPVDIDGLGALRRPLRGGGRGLGLRGEEAGGVARPLGLAGGPRVDRERAPLVILRFVDVDLQLVHGVARDHQRGLQRELVERRQVRGLAGVQGELDQRGPGQQHGAVDGVVGEPRVGLQRQAAGQQPFVLARHRHGGGQQRVAARLGGGLRREPVVLVLEGVGRQVQRARARVQRAPVGTQAAEVRVGDQPGQRFGLGPLRAQRGGDGGVGDHARERGQRAVGPEFDVARDALRLERADAVGEPDRLAGVLDPVAGRGDLVAGELPGEVGDDRQLGGVVGQALGDRAELVEHRVHQVRVECVADGQPRGLAALLAPVRLEFGDRLGEAGDDGRPRPVDRGEVDLVRQLQLLLGGLDGQHRAAVGERAHQPPAGTDQRGGVGEREHAGDVRGGDLSDGMPHHDVGCDPDRVEQAVERDLEREQRGLRVLGAVEAVAGEHPFSEARGEVFEDLVQGAGEHGVGLVELRAHAGALGALAGEQERRSAGDRRALDEVVAEQGRAVLELRARRRQCHGDVGERDAGVDGQPRAQPLDLVAQGVLGLGGEHERQRRRVDGGGRLDRGSLLEDQVRVGAADAERGHTGAPRAPVALPRLRLGQQLHGTRGPVDVRRRLVGVQRRRQLLVLQGHDHLDHARDAGRGLRMADVGLDRTQLQRRFAVLAVGGQQRPGPRSDRRARCPCRAPRRRRRRSWRRRRWPAPAGSRVPARARWAR